MPPAGSSDDTWTLPDVYLLTSGEDGRVAIPHLELTFLSEGMVVGRADGEPVWSAEWADLDELSTQERSVLPDGRDGVVLLVVERGRKRRHRFVLPADDAGTTEASIAERARAHRLRTNTTAPALSRSLTVAVVVAAAAVLTVLLLSAAHVIHL